MRKRNATTSSPPQDPASRRAWLASELSKLGTGKSKVRGDSAYYAALARRSAVVQKKARTRAVRLAAKALRDLSKAEAL